MRAEKAVLVSEPEDCTRGGRVNWPYIAGFFDGEGTVGLYFQKSMKYGGTGYINVRMTQRLDKVLLVIGDFLEAHGIRSLLRRYPYSQLSSKPQTALELRRRDIPFFLVEVMPFLVVKKTLVQDILRYRKLFPPFTPQMRGRLAMETRWGHR